VIVLHLALVAQLIAIAMIAKIKTIMRRERQPWMPLLREILLLSNLRLKIRASMPRAAIAKRVAALRNIVNATKVEYLAPTYAHVKAVRTVMKAWHDLKVYMYPQRKMMMISLWQTRNLKIYLTLNNP
jgi:histone acetyltransferase (RNA polymerase elongator complex component)